jgi:mannose-6-phosphate isomerase-like protein (cupin superfamily)
MTYELRRVVTGVDETGKAVVLSDGENPHKTIRPIRNNVSRRIWVTDQTPADISGREDRGLTDIGVAPPPGGTVFRIVEYPPVTPDVEALDPSARMRELGAEAAGKGRPPRHPLMHRTRSLDYAIIMSGEIHMLLDDSEVHLKAGDVLIQQGTNHAWINRGTEVCRIAFVLIDAKEP